MALLDVNSQAHAQLERLFEKIRGGQAPEKFTREHLKDIGFNSSNHHSFISLLKGLGFLTADGSPTESYRLLLDETKWRNVLGNAVRSAYSDLFVISKDPGSTDKKAIEGKFKSTYNHTDLVAQRSASTFLKLWELCEKTPSALSNEQIVAQPDVEKPDEVGLEKPPRIERQISSIGLRYNIQIHLPPTKDIEVYNSIFKSLKEHLIDE